MCGESAVVCAFVFAFSSFVFRPECSSGLLGCAETAHRGRSVLTIVRLRIIGTVIGEVKVN